MYQIYSPYMLKTFEECPKKFYFKYIKSLSMPQDDDIFELGKNIHALASYYLNKENIYKMEQSLNENEKLIWEYLKNVNYFSYETVNTEYNLSVKLDDYYFGGRLDALVKNEEKYFILDYKTGAAPKNAKYDYQTMIYLLAVSVFFKTHNVVFVYLDLKNKTEVCIELNEDLINEYRTKLISSVNSINKSDYNKIKNNCNCEYNIICY